MGKLPSYRRHSSGQARVTINGRAHYLGVYGSPASKQAYKVLLAEWLASGEPESFGVAQQQLTMAQVMADYLSYCKKYYGPTSSSSSEYSNIRQAIRPVAKLYSDLRAADFGPVQFKAVRQMLIESECTRMKPKRNTKTKRRKPKATVVDKQVSRPKLSRGYTNDLMKRVCRMFRWAATEGMLPASTYDTLRLIPSLQRGRTEAREAESVKPVPESLVMATIPHCSPVVGAMIRVQLLTGMRPGEVVILTPGMIDRSTDVWQARLEHHKTANKGKSRTIYFGPTAQQVLMPYLLRGADEPLFSPREALSKLRAQRAEDRTTPMNQGNRAGYGKRSRAGAKPSKQAGDQYDTNSYRTAVAYGIRKGKLEHWSPNQLRHTAATKIRAEFGLDAAAAMLGHARVETTQIYAELDCQKAIDAARKIG